jgi:DNA polymerase I
MNRLPFRQLWAVDFEFRADPGARPEPVCMVARELRSGRLLRLWRDELPARPPFPVDADSLFIAYAAQAELGCFLELGWPLPARILDLYLEFSAATNGLERPGGRSLLTALSWHGIPGITKDEKAAGRALAMQGTWTTSERAALLDYCQTDVDPLGPLLERMLPAILGRPGPALGHALLRGRFTAAVARMERAGVPIDTVMLGRLRRQWHAIQRDLIRAVDADYGVYDGATFKADRFETWLQQQGIPWPRTDTGRLQLDRDTFKAAGNIYPQVSPLRELRTSLSEMRLEKLAVGADGRNRAPLMPFAARSSRNTPSNSKFIFGPSVWLRGLIKPAQGRALAYIDWSAQEVAIAAALSGDQALLDAVQSGDPYLRFAKLAGLAPEDATKQSHDQVRNLCKTCLLGSNYGMGTRSLAQRTGTSLLVAEQTQRSLARAFPVFWQWAEHVVDVGELRGELSTVFGWTLRVTRDTRPTTLRNFPAQANAAEMLRVACCLATERGVQVCAPVHDALLVEAADGDLADAVSTARAAMSAAARVVLDGIDIGTEATVVAWPERYADPRGRVMWQRVTELLQDEVDQHADTPAGWSYRPPLPKPLRRSERKGSGDRRGRAGQVRCAACGKWIRRRPDVDDWDAEERAYAGDEFEEHDCAADFDGALDLTSEEEWAAWEAAERERLAFEVEEVSEVGEVEEVSEVGEIGEVSEVSEVEEVSKVS